MNPAVRPAMMNLRTSLLSPCLIKEWEVRTTKRAVQYRVRRKATARKRPPAPWLVPRTVVRPMDPDPNRNWSDPDGGHFATTGNVSSSPYVKIAARDGRNHCHK